MEEFRRDAPSFEAGREPTVVVELERRDAELTVLGPVDALEALAERPITGGAVGFEGAGVALGAAGLSHEEKKSSSSALAAGVALLSVAPSTTTLSGYLHTVSIKATLEYEDLLGGVFFNATGEFLLI